MKRALPPTVILMVATALSQPAGAYLRIGDQVGEPRMVWKRLPVTYFVTDRGVPGVSPLQLQSAIDRSFRVWNDLPTASTPFRFGGFTSAAPGYEDGLTTLGFLDRPEFAGVLGATAHVIDVQTGEIIESDILFNAAYPWSVADGGETGKFDVESVAVHEIGHLLGLGHSGLGEVEARTGSIKAVAAEAVMFPLAFDPGTIDGRRLKADDVAGISGLYPEAAFRSQTGSVRGRVRLAGHGALRAHIVAFNPQTRRLIAGFALGPEGDFTIEGLDPGLHILRVEPIDDGTVASFFDPSEVDVGFKTKYSERLVVVPRGGSATAPDITVEAK